MPIATTDDKIRLGEEGWKTRYYSNKFSVTNAKDQTEFTALIK